MQIKVFVAIPSELPKEICPEGFELIYTGVGKVNAAIRATQSLMQADPKETVVINYGSAGSNIHPIHSIIKCKKFQQADMDARPLSPDWGHTPFDDIIHPHVETGILIFNEEGGTCTTQDKFQLRPVFEVNDMEAYGIAKVCRILGFDFTAYKFISDSGDANEWADNHHLGIEGFLDILRADYLT
jgi:adenosylhomocysteine nucleosidase